MASINISCPSTTLSRSQTCTSFRVFNGLHSGTLYSMSGFPLEFVVPRARTCLRVRKDGRIKSVLVSDEGDLLSHTNGPNNVVKNSTISGIAAGIEIQADSVQFGTLAADIAPTTTGFPADNDESDLDQPTEGFSSISEAIQDIRNGKIVLVVDDEDRENEGDLIMAASKVTPEAMAFFVKHGTGIVCVSMKEEDLERLNLPLMVNSKDNEEKLCTAFTVSVDAKHGTSTGVSARDRATTILALASKDSKPEDFNRPGHIFPLKYREGGVLKRAGHTEASVDLSVLAGLEPVGVLCEVVDDDGSMARLPKLRTLLILSYTSSSPHPSLPPPHPSLFPPDSPYRHLFLSTTKTTSDKTNQNPPPPPPPPSIAYLLSGSSNDTGRILRLLFSIYHPRNTYLLHLDSTASQAERDDLAFKIQSFPLFKAAQNVNVVGKANVVYQLGSSSVSAVLHGASILLRISKNWDWFINLSVDDYPLVTQDDLLHILSYLPKDLNFINHTSYIGWIESRKLKPIIVDPGLYLSEENEVFYATQKRVLPDAFRLFTGSSSAILSRKFLEFCTLGTDNLPRTVLMYLANTPSSNSVYFPTILCNSRQFNRTTINHNLQYVSLNSRKEPHLLNSSYYNDVVQSGAAFASRFLPDDPILDRIDQEILHRGPGKPVPGGWCLGESGLDSCQVWGDAAVLQPGPGAKRLERCLLGILSEGTFRSQQCVID